MKSQETAVRDEQLEKYFLDCTVSPKYDVIAFEFYLYTDSFVFRRSNPHGYKLMKHYVLPPSEPYLPIWEIDKYRNLETGNLIFYQISSRMFDKFRKIKYMVKIFFHGERNPITSHEINQFLNMVIESYRNFTDGLNKSTIRDTRMLEIPTPYLSMVEISLDFRGNNVRFLYENMRDNLYKLRCRKRKSINDEEIREPKYTFDERVLYGAFPTHYISDSYRDYVGDDKDGHEVFRVEMVLTKSYLKRKKLQNTDDLESLDKTQYWTDNYFFWRLDKEKILAYVSKKKPEWVNPIAILLDSDGITTLSEIYTTLKNDYILGDRPLFKYPSRQLLTTKWYKFDAMIQGALNGLSLSGLPVEGSFEPIQRKRGKLPAKKGRKSREIDILNAIQSLIRQGRKTTYKEIAREAGITEKTIAKYKHLLNR